MDIRFTTLAENLINYSCELKAGEKVLIETIGFETELTNALIEEAYRVGALPFVISKNPKIERKLLTNCTVEQLELMASWDTAKMNEMDAYIGIRSGENPFEMSDVPSDKMEIYNKYYSHPVHHGIRVPKTKWVILRYPNDSMAQLANMPTEKFADYFFQVCNMNYQKMSDAMKPLVKIMTEGKKVRVTGANCDLAFSIEGIDAIPCDGKRNIPDGEVYTAPVKDSINGYITYNIPTINQGTTFNDIHLVFENGKIIEATCMGDNTKLNAILDSDAGSRFIGEFAIGVNPFVNQPILDILFDEKIYGSFHFTPGACYEEASNGNESVIHWDLVYSQTPAYGGGEIYIDDVLIRKDGEFVHPDLLGLNKSSY